MTEPTPGARLGRHELLVRIGRGGMASVWVARERSARSGKQRLVAVKAMLPGLAGRADFRSMFLEEGQIVQSIDHPNVVQVYEVNEDAGILYMAMEWVEGDSLRTLIHQAKKRRAIPPEMAMRIIADTAGGLHAAHELRGWDGELRGIVHCDVSPHNILVGIDGRAKLVDFGVAHAMESLDEGERLKGKFGYMSPEQAQGQPIDRRSDVFALGIVLFELTTGERLFKGVNKQHTLELVQWKKIPRPSELFPGYPAGLEAIVMRALERDREVRFQTADELKRALERHLVEQRTLVSQAGVGRLVRRVLGERVEQRRAQIRAVLAGSQDSSLVPSRAAMPSELDQSVISSTGHSSEQSSSVASSLESATAGPATLEPRSKRTGVWLGAGVVGAMLVVALVVASLSTAEKTTSDAPESAPAIAPRPAAPAAPRPRVSTGPRGLSVGSLPLASADAGDGSASSSSGSGGSWPPTTEDEPGDKIVLEEEEEVAEEKVTLSEEVAPAKVKLEEDRPAPPPPSARGPLNRGAAIAALGSAARAASGCKAPGGPSGSGRATVTFAPTGSVSAVSISSPFAGTAVGSCVAGRFRAASIPAFTGGPVTLGYGFFIPN